MPSFWTKMFCFLGGLGVLAVNLFLWQVLVLCRQVVEVLEHQQHAEG